MTNRGHAHHQNGHRPGFALKDDAVVENQRPLKVIAIGAGLSGIYLAIRLSQRLRNVQLTIYEKNPDLGGTWFENRYPGCACDIPSHSYQYSFAPNPGWSAFYAPSEEIWRYLKDVAARYSVERFVKYQQRVERCEWDERAKKWRVSVRDLETGQVNTDEAEVLVSARGALNEKQWPSLPGLKSFGGKLVHSAAWDKTFDYGNKRIGVIGSGSSAIQIVPALQKLPGVKLWSFSRGKTWISPSFGEDAEKILKQHGLEFSEQNRREFRTDPGKYQRFRKIVEAEGNSVHGFTMRDSPIQKGARQAFEQLMRARLANKPEIADQMVPDFAAGCKRLTPGPGYLEALVEENVAYISTPIDEVTATGVVLTDGRVVELDVLVCATGFNTSHLPPFPIIGLHGTTIASQFTPYPETYLSVAVSKLPNFFMMLGPNGAIGTGSLSMMIETQGDYIVKCIRKLQKEDLASMAAKADRVRDFSEYIDAYFEKTVYLDGCKSWYRSGGGLGNRIVGLWPGSTLHCIVALRSPRWEDVEDEHAEGDNPNFLRWLGNGWSSTQKQERKNTSATQGGDAAWYLEPAFVDPPREPFPEESSMYRSRCYTH